MIAADTQKMIEAARQLDLQADIVDKTGRRLEEKLRAARVEKKILGFIARPTADIKALQQQRITVVEGLRDQSLFLRECAKRYKNTQSLAAVRAEHIK